MAMLMSKYLAAWLPRGKIPAETRYFLLNIKYIYIYVTFPLLLNWARLNWMCELSWNRTQPRVILRKRDYENTETKLKNTSSSYSSWGKGSGISCMRLCCHNKQREGSLHQVIIFSYNNIFTMYQFLCRKLLIFMMPSNYKAFCLFRVLHMW